MTANTPQDDHKDVIPTTLDGWLDRAISAADQDADLARQHMARAEIRASSPDEWLTIATVWYRAFQDDTCAIKCTELAIDLAFKPKMPLEEILLNAALTYRDTLGIPHRYYETLERLIAEMERRSNRHRSDASYESNPSWHHVVQGLINSSDKAMALDVVKRHVAACRKNVGLFDIWSNCCRGSCERIVELIDDGGSIKLAHAVKKLRQTEERAFRFSVVMNIVALLYLVLVVSILAWEWGPIFGLLIYGGVIYYYSLAWRKSSLRHRCWQLGDVLSNVWYDQKTRMYYYQ